MVSEWNLPEIFDFWKGVQGSFFKILDYLSDEDLEFNYDSEMRNLGELFTHVANAYHWWLEYIIHDGQGIKPDLDVSKSIEEIKSRLRRAHQRIWGLIEKSSWNDLRKEYEVEEEGTRTTVSLMWILWHLVEHDVHHRAQIGLYLKKLGKKISPKDFWNQPVL